MIDQRCITELEKIINSEIDQERKKQKEKNQRLTTHMTLEDFWKRYCLEEKEYL